MLTDIILIVCGIEILRGYKVHTNTTTLLVWLPLASVGCWLATFYLSADFFIGAITATILTVTALFFKDKESPTYFPKPWLYTAIGVGSIGLLSQILYRLAIAVA